ncbi:MAG: preprotein translocase subunit SecE [Dehalococcoidia bacterium]|nr:preprotein translocase subunit SecE [Dehalococcoidia bacterium]
MSRAVRRQQAAAPKEGASKRGSLGLRAPRQSRGAAPPPRQRRRIGIPSWFEEIISELKKVTWPTREETIYLTTVVIIVSVIVGAMLGVIDIFFNWLVDRLLLE